MAKMTHCRACLAPDPYLFLPLGDHPPAQGFVRPEDLAKDQPAFALDTEVCLTCGLIQVEDQIPPDYFRQYLYVPSGAATLHGHFGELAAVLVGKAGGGLIVDIGCNDGLMLMQANALGARTLGIDPAANIAELARARGIDVHVAYFDPQSAAEVRAGYGPAKVICSTNTVNHIGDLHAFMKAIDHLLDSDGWLVLELPWAKDLLEGNEFDTVYHEHTSEFSILSLAKLGAFFDFRIVDIARLPVHGGSMRVFLRRSTHPDAPLPVVQAMLDEELAHGMLDPATYDGFADRVGQVRRDLLNLLDNFKQRGKKIAGYGAPAKGNTLLIYCGIGSETLDFLVDRNPLKHGLYSPGLKIPVKPVEAIAAENIDVLLVLAWNFIDEIAAQQAEFLGRGGVLVVPLPSPWVIER